MYQQYRPSNFQVLPPAVKNLLIINGLCFLANFVLEQRGVTDLNAWFGLYYPASWYFKPWQLLTHMFMHGSFMHLFFNMFSLWMFGSVIENYWGAKRFTIYYLCTAFGGAAIYLLVKHFEYQKLLDAMSISYGAETGKLLEAVKEQGRGILSDNKNYIDKLMGDANILLNVPVVGASGAVFGVLLAFGMMFPNTELLMLFLPIPIKAKYFVMIYGGLELFQGIADRPSDNVAHFAHLGGMLFGFILIKFWNKRSRNTFY